MQDKKKEIKPELSPRLKILLEEGIKENGDLLKRLED